MCLHIKQCSLATSPEALALSMDTEASCLSVLAACCDVTAAAVCTSSAAAAPPLKREPRCIPATGGSCLAAEQRLAMQRMWSECSAAAALLDWTASSPVAGTTDVCSTPLQRPMEHCCASHMQHIVSDGCALPCSGICLHRKDGWAMCHLSSWQTPQHHGLLLYSRHHHWQDGGCRQGQHTIDSGDPASAFCL